MGHRPIVIIGNWKMNKTIAEARSFISGLALSTQHNSLQVGVAVPFTSLAVAAEAARNTSIKIGAQNVSDHDEGAYTGEVSCAMAKDAGASFVLVGHSERRRLFSEDDRVVNCKIKKILDSGLKAVVCIGESLHESQSGKAHDVLRRQILQGLEGLSSSQLNSISLAYEPIWAIGAHHAATPDITQERHVFCRSCIAEKWGKEVAEQVVIQYGGSVTTENASALVGQTDVDGLLVGGASLSLDSFSKILQACS